MRRLPCGRGERMKPELKDLFKPPFRVSEFEKNVIVDSENSHVVIIPLGLPYFLENNEEYGNFILQAISTHWKREFGEPLHWVYVKGFWYACPKCKSEQPFPRVKDFENYCPDCGTRLLPPKKNQEQKSTR